MAYDSLITIDNIRTSLKTETGVTFGTNNFFLTKIVDQFAQNMWALKDQAKQKAAIFALANNVAKFAAAQVDFSKDFDKIDVVFRGGIPCLSMRTQLLPRILARRGYLYNDFFAPIAAGSNARFVEKLTSAGRRISIFDDDDRAQPIINVENIVKGAIDRFAIRISIGKSPDAMLDFCAIVPASEIIAAANASDNGFFKVSRETVKDQYGRDKKVRKVTDTLNADPTAPWIKFTSEMVKKVCVHRLQKVISETFPEIADAAALTDEDSYTEPERITPDDSSDTAAKTVEAEASVKTSWTEFTEDQAAEIRSAYQSYKQMPDLLLADLDKAAADLPNPDTPEARAAAKATIIEKHRPALYVLLKSQKLQEQKPEYMEKFGWLFE